MGKARIIPQSQLLADGLKVHRSVRTRMMAEYKDEALRTHGKRYKPKPVLFQGDDYKEHVQWVD